MKPFEIFRGHNVKWGKHCDYDHYWVIVDCRGTDFGCFPISSSCYDQYCFLLDPSHPDFPITGLDHASYIIYTTIVELEPGELGKQKGALTGQLLSDFRREAGV